MRFYELDCKITGAEFETIREILVADLAEIGYESFDEVDEGLLAYILEKDFDINKVAEVDSVKSLFPNNIEYTYQLIEEQNWNQVWESNFPAIEVDGKVYVRAPFHPEKEGFEYEILIDPKMAFGTGHHSTTFLMIKQILNNEFAGKTVLDMGCGTGILAIMAKMRGATDVTAIDIDEWSYNNTIENVKINNAEPIHTILGDSSVIPDVKFDTIIANINRNILIMDMGVYANHLKTGGELYLSGFYTEDVKKITDEAAKHNLKFIDFMEDKNWVSAKLIKE